MRTATLYFAGDPFPAAVIGIECRMPDNDVIDHGGVIFDYLGCLAEHVLVASIDENREFTDGRIEDHLMVPLVELFSVGLLSRTTCGRGSGDLQGHRHSEGPRAGVEGTMKDEDWLKPFNPAPQHPLPAAAALPATVSGWTPELQAERRADLRERIARVMKPYAPKPKAALDPEAALIALFAAHETAVYDAAAAARQQLASRRVAWRMGRTLDGHPVA